VDRLCLSSTFFGISGVAGSLNLISVVGSGDWVGEFSSDEYPIPLSLLDAFNFTRFLGSGISSLAFSAVVPGVA